METNNLYINPYIRVLFAVFGIAGTLLINRISLLICFYLVVILPLFICGQQVKKHIQLMLFGMLPVFLSFVLLYILVLKGNEGGWNFVFMRTSKLILITSIIQLTLLIPAPFLIHTFQQWRLKEESLITVLGSFTVWTDIRFRAQQILTARFSRGFIRKRTFTEKIKQFPPILIPLVIGILRTSTERAESWESKNILHLIEINQTEKIKTPLLLNVFVCLSASIWMITGVLVFFIT
ncbi:MAG: energy-coupling factor transporter transmembrane protein EcfT [Dysgonamonadaceae bacterium]|jgi:hypothetical protein|nr:energy-coupling factor transporter transmembrane protein EcfT [Dysgonamonadaceae bacterium]